MDKFKKWLIIIVCITIFLATLAIMYCCFVDNEDGTKILSFLAIIFSLISSFIAIIQSFNNNKCNYNK